MVNDQRTTIDHATRMNYGRERADWLRGYLVSVKAPRLTSQSMYAQLGGVIAAAGVIVLVLSGCSATAGNGRVEPSDSSTPTTPAASATTATPTPVAGEEIAPHDEAVPVDPTAAKASTAIAVDAVTRFCRPTLSYDAWIEDLYPLLSQQAAVAYETVDPAKVPCTTLVGQPSVRDGDGAYTMRVLVPTDAAEYLVYVHRVDTTLPWLVEQITPLGFE